MIYTANNYLFTLQNYIKNLKHQHPHNKKDERGNILQSLHHANRPSPTPSTIHHQRLQPPIHNTSNRPFPTPSAGNHISPHSTSETHPHHSPLKRYAPYRLTGMPHTTYTGMPHTGLVVNFAYYATDWQATSAAGGATQIIYAENTENRLRLHPIAEKTPLPHPDNPQPQKILSTKFRFHLDNPAKSPIFVTRTA